MQSVPDDIFLLFDFAAASGAPERLCFTKPVEIIAAHTNDEVQTALRAVEQATRAGLYAAGYVSYEAAAAFDPALAVHHAASAPLLWFAFFRAPSDSPPHTPGAFQVSEWQPTTDRQTYERNVTTVRAAIARGDTYQVNYTIRLRAQFAGDAYAFYTRLAAKQRAAYCAYLHTGRHAILSVSPELFFHWHGRQITTRPMKGTMRRGRWLAEDERFAAALAASEKNRAENVMIVDLMRNDLGRIAATGTVEVRDLCRVERYPTVLQMTSTVAAETRADVQLTDIFAALFPCGSVTGAPKVSTMRLIAALEAAPRRVYCGSIGLIKPNGEAIFNVAIRTVLIDRTTGAAEYGTGGGITWDSTAAEEYEEALTKAAPLAADWPEFQLLETLLLADGRYALLARHLERLESSARYFAFSISIAAARQMLETHARSFPVDVRRVRLLVSADGAMHIESRRLDEAPRAPLPIALAATPVARADPFLYHKTTHRVVYESQRAQHAATFDVLLWNEARELTEFTNGNLVVELDGRRFTPPRECGLLAGTMRAELLARGEIIERVITHADLAHASRLWLINSVRGWLEVFVRADESRAQGSAAVT